jgi:Nucleotidyltransferase domain
LPVSENTALVFFGSVGRGEFTAKSDLDWCLLVDGPADQEHGRLVGELRRSLKEFAAEPGATFGNIVGSHDLVHHIGGTHDTTANFTLRMLLLLESMSATDPIVHDRVIRSILTRYVNVSASVAWKKTPKEIVPRFLLNDFVRYWRTIAVDYAAKRWEQDDRKWALRNAKLRMSRKLLFVTGLLMCLRYELMPKEHTERLRLLEEPYQFASRFAGLLLQQTKQRPLDVLSEMLLDNGIPIKVATSILDPYDEFLSLIDQPKKRHHLEMLGFDASATDGVFNEVRDIGRRFQDGINLLFFDSSPKLRELVLKYGVF